MNRERGFTLIELLLVMVIMGILVLIGVGAFFSSLQKGRDTTRKANLRAITSAVEMYYNDKKGYPVSDGSGSIPGCYTTDLTASGTCGTAFPVLFDSTVANNKGAIYMAKFPVDPVSGLNYYYVSNGTQYQIYAHLENSQDPQCLQNACPVPCNCAGSSAPVGNSCGGVCNYGVSSANTNP